MSSSDSDDVTAERDPRPAQFEGFADSAPDLYEFKTAEGQRVSLHEGYFESLQYEVGAPPTITVTFVFAGDNLPSLTSSARTNIANARVSLRFGDAYVIAWESSQEMPQYRSDGTLSHGQVDDFYVYARRCFCIGTIDDTIYVEATTVEVSPEPLSADEVRRALAQVAGRPTP